MAENVKEYYLSISDFKEYVEMWIHEVKIPISSLTLLNHNHHEQIDKKYVEQIRKLDNYIDQILYYVRSENGRTRAKSTGMGLFIAKKLCDKLGHKIVIESNVMEYTKITIMFSKNHFYKIKD